MTTVYFIRHAESDFSVLDSRVRPLTEKGMADRALVTEFLRDKRIDAVFSSPYKRAVDTVADFAHCYGMDITTDEGFKEITGSRDWSEAEFYERIRRLWADDTFTMADGESLADVQKRNIAALHGAIGRHKDGCIAIGTHGVALSAIINYYDGSYSAEDFFAMNKIMPWVVKMEFDGSNCAAIEKIDLFDPDILPVLYEKMQMRLNVQSSKDELWDVYDENQQKTGRTHRRGDPLAPGDYHLAAFAWLRNAKGEYLIIKRAPEKTFPNMWDIPGGAALAGDDGLAAAVRELKEETGLDVCPMDGAHIMTNSYKDTFFDNWLFETEFDLNAVVLQEGETSDAKCATEADIRRMVKNGEFIHFDNMDELFKKIHAIYHFK